MVLSRHRDYQTLYTLIVCTTDSTALVIILVYLPVYHIKRNNQDQL